MAATKTPYTATASNAVVLDEGTIRCQYHGNCFTRGLVIQFDVAGDLEGTWVTDLNINFLREAYLLGTFVLTTSEVTYEGTMNGTDPTGTGTAFSGSLVAHGSDGTELIDSTWSFEQDPAVLEGIIPDP